MLYGVEVTTIGPHINRINDKPSQKCRSRSRTGRGPIRRRLKAMAKPVKKRSKHERM